GGGLVLRCPVMGIKVTRDPSIAALASTSSAAPTESAKKKDAAAAPAADKKPGWGPKPPKASGTSFTAASHSTSHVTTRLIDNQQYLPELMSLLDGAQKSINIAQYNMYSESGDAKAITNKLIALKKDKPDLQINVFMEGDHGDGATRNQATAARLKAAGINVQLDSKNLITHEKVVSVDGSKVLAGSHNMTNTSMDKNNEVSLSINSGTLAKAYDKYFQQLQSDPSNLH